MQSYFVDTWFLIARYDPTDGHHAASVALDRRLAAAHLMSHDAVITEFLAYTSAYGPHLRRGAVRFAQRFMTRAHIVPADHALFLAAIDLYDARPDKEYSLVDCMSMLVMRAEGIAHVLTNDHHFRQEGFTVVSA